MSIGSSWFRTSLQLKALS
uniref:Uncharacterized protein n=1 Tax=Arundo donax TaxID=35708 RepID=A0A0A9BEY8_ARUDO